MIDYGKQDLFKAIWARHIDRMMNGPSVFEDIIKKPTEVCMNENVSEKHIDDGVVRTFETGATRDTSTNKPDLEGYLCPKVLEVYAEYMLSNQFQSDGTIRPSAL
jgi:hypothetical protein